jgi:hypothetical protein
MKWILKASLVISALALPSLTAHANGPFDGTWRVDSGGLGTPTAQAMEGTSCAPEILKFEIAGNQVHGSLAVVQSDPNRVINSELPGSAPVTGTVQADGTINASWENYTATGKITGDKVEMRWQAPCGPRVAMGSRISPAASAGSTTGH